MPSKVVQNTHLLLTSVGFLSSASFQALATSNPYAAALTFGGVVTSAAAGAFLARFLAKKQEAEDDQIAERNHHVRRGMAEALRDALRAAKSRFTESPADLYEKLYQSWLDTLDTAIDQKNQDSLESLFPVCLSEEQFRLLVRYDHAEQSNPETCWLDEDQQRYVESNKKDELALSEILRERLTFAPQGKYTILPLRGDLLERWDQWQALEFAAKLLPLYRNAFAVIFSKGGAAANAIEYKGQVLTLDFLERISNSLERLSGQIHQEFVIQGDLIKDATQTILVALEAGKDKKAATQPASSDKYRRVDSLDPVLSDLENLGTAPGRRRDIGVALNDAEGGDPRPGVGVFAGYPDIHWCHVPASQVELSINSGARNDSHTFGLTEYFISKYAVTCAQFSAYVSSEDGYTNPEWWHGKSGLRERSALRPQGDANSPQTGVNWCEANAFCKWLSAKLSKRLLSSGMFDGRWEVRLPYEWEWQHAAMGSASKRYTWGDDWRVNHANTSEANLNGFIAVGMFPHGRSHCGALDMIGNVHEWCANECNTFDTASPSNIPNAKCSVRGGSSKTGLSEATCMHRDNRKSIVFHSNEIGFRIVCVRAG